MHCFSSSQDYLGAVIVLTAAVAAICSSCHLSSYGVKPGLVGLGLTYALTVRCNSNYHINVCHFIEELCHD